MKLDYARPIEVSRRDFCAQATSLNAPNRGRDTIYCNTRVQARPSDWELVQLVLSDVAVGVLKGG